MPNITGGEILIILLVALIVLGPQRLPEAARTVSKAAREFRRVQSSVETEIRSTIDEVTKPVTETASAMQQSIDEAAKDVSPGGPRAHGSAAAASPRGAEPDGRAATAPSAPTDPTGTASSEAPAGPAAGDGEPADSPPSAAPLGAAGGDGSGSGGAASGNGVFTPRGSDRSGSRITPDDWGEADLYDDVR